MHNFVYLAQRRSQELSCKPNFGWGACPPVPLAAPLNSHYLSNYEQRGGSTEGVPPNPANSCITILLPVVGNYAVKLTARVIAYIVLLFISQHVLDRHYVQLYLQCIPPIILCFRVVRPSVRTCVRVSLHDRAEAVSHRLAVNTSGPILNVFSALIVHSELKSVHPGFPVAFIF